MTTELVVKKLLLATAVVAAAGGDVQVDLGGFLCFHIVMFLHSSLLMYSCCNFDQEGRQVGSIQS